MNPEILSTKNDKGELRIDLRISAEDVAAALDEAHELVERIAAEDPSARSNAEKFENEFVLAKAANAALYELEVEPCATTDIAPVLITRDSIEDVTFYITAYPTPPLMLTSIDPIPVKSKRIPMPGQSMKAAAEGADVDYIPDEQLLKVEIPNRLLVDLPEKLRRRVVTEYSDNFSQMLSANHTSVEQYQANMDEETYKGLMNMEATNKLCFELALDAFYMAYGLQVTDEEIDAAFAEMFPGESSYLREVFEKRGDMGPIVRQACRNKTYNYLKEHAE